MTIVENTPLPAVYSSSPVKAVPEEPLAASSASLKTGGDKVAGRFESFDGSLDALREEVQGPGEEETVKEKAPSGERTLGAVPPLGLHGRRVVEREKREEASDHSSGVERALYWFGVKGEGGVAGAAFHLVDKMQANAITPWTGSDSIPTLPHHGAEPSARCVLEKAALKAGTRAAMRLMRGAGLPGAGLRWSTGTLKPLQETRAGTGEVATLQEAGPGASAGVAGHGEKRGLWTLSPVPQAMGKEGPSLLTGVPTEMMHSGAGKGTGAGLRGGIRRGARPRRSGRRRHVKGHRAGALALGETRRSVEGLAGGNKGEVRKRGGADGFRVVEVGDDAASLQGFNHAAPEDATLSTMGRARSSGPDGSSISFAGVMPPHEEKARGLSIPTQVDPGQRGADLLEKAAKGLLLSLSRARREVTMELDPPELGRMRIRVNLRERSVDAHFVVEHARVMALLNGHAPGLREHLLRQGLTLGGLEVVLRGHENLGDRGKRSNEREGQRGGRWNGALGRSGPVPGVDGRGAPVVLTRGETYGTRQGRLDLFV